MTLRRLVDASGGAGLSKPSRSLARCKRWGLSYVVDIDGPDNILKSWICRNGGFVSRSIVAYETSFEINARWLMLGPVITRF